MTQLTPSAVSAAELIAAVDLGSNSFHLVIARIIDGALQLLHREKQKVQLADGLDEQQMLSEEAMNRGLLVLKQFADTLQGVPASSVRVIATYTLRRAKNANSFLHKAKAVFPFPIEVISGQEEARFIYQGVAHFEHYAGQRLVMDIGGGSTEFAIGLDFQPLRLASRNMGCVSYARQFFAKGKISEKRFERAIIQAEQELENIVNNYKTTGWQQVVGTSGTIKTIKDIITGLGWHPHCIELEHLEKIKTLALAHENCDELDLPGLTEDRKQLLCPGLAILMLYVEAALRLGVLYEMSDRLQHQDIRSHTVASLVKRYAIDTEQAQRVNQTLQNMLAQLQGSWQLQDEWPQLLGWAANLYEIGLQINSSSVQRHSAYILSNASLPGFNQEQQQLLACLVRFHRRKIKTEKFPPFYLYQHQQVVQALVLFRLAVLFNQKRRDDVAPALVLTAKDQQLELHISAEWYRQQTVLAADLVLEQQQLAVLGIQLLLPGLPTQHHDE
jgi:exopolyphosphatase / guanosine-5'-triphosphate,3'-diphosphate pyrophosphatase